MTRPANSSPFRAAVQRITALEWAGLGGCVVLGLTLAAVLRSQTPAPVSWLVWTSAACHLLLLGLWAWRGRAGATSLYAVLCAVPATLLACVTGGLAGAGLVAVFWPVLFALAAGLKLRVAVAASLASAFAGTMLGAITGPLASNSGELPPLTATSWAGAVALAMAGLYLAAALASPTTARSRQVQARLASQLADSEARAQAASATAANAVAEAAAKARFMAEMSHEIRNPLTAILGFSETMREEVLGPMPGAYSDYPRLIHDSGRHLLDLVSDLLDLSKIEAGRYSVARVPVRLDLLASQAVEMMAGAAAQARVRLRLRASGPVEALGDSKALRQSMLNLLSNAIKFTPEGGQIQVGAGLAADGTRAVLEVRDTGAGMDAAQLALATELYASSGEQPRGARGTGLGLALVRQLSGLQGGQFTLDSAPGAGTTARIILSSVSADPTV